MECKSDFYIPLGPRIVIFGSIKTAEIMKISLHCEIGRF